MCFSSHVQLLGSFKTSLSTPEFVVTIWGTSVPSMSPTSPISLIVALGRFRTNGIWREVSGWITEKHFLHVMEVLVPAATEFVKGPAKVATLVCRGRNVG